MPGGVTGPGDPVLRQQNLEPGRRASLAKDDVVASVRQPASDAGRIVHGRRQTDAADARRKSPQPRQPQRQQVPSLGSMDGVDFVDDHAFQILEIVARALPGAEQGQLFGRGQQNVRGGCPLTLAPGLAGVARARLHEDGEIHFPDRGQEVPFDIDRQGLEGGDVERMKGLAAFARAPFGQL